MFKLMFFIVLIENQNVVTNNAVSFFFETFKHKNSKNFHLYLLERRQKCVLYKIRLSYCLRYAVKRTINRIKV